MLNIQNEVGYTQEDIAKVLGVTQGMCSYILSKSGAIRPDYGSKLQQAYDGITDEMLQDTQEIKLFLVKKRKGEE